MKRILAALAGLALAASVSGIALADHGGYHNDCSRDGSKKNEIKSSHPGKGGDVTEVYNSDSADQRKGFVGIVGSRGYLEAGGDASKTGVPTGGIHGTTANKEFYGYVGDKGVCVGSGGTKQWVELP